MKPYFESEGVQLYLGDMREVLPGLGVTADLLVVDPPYSETSLAWDRWPNGWLKVAAAHSESMWCFGSMRMYFRRYQEFQDAGWKLSQDIVGEGEDGAPLYGDVNVVWEKHAGSGFTTDRFNRVHEHVLHWYQGPWSGIQHTVPRVPAQFDAKGRTTSHSAAEVPHTGKIGAHQYIDDGLRLMRSVIKAKSVRGKGRNGTEKPGPLLDPLIEYACRPGGTVLDPMAGSGSVLEAARRTGRPAIGIEERESQAEAAARRLSALVIC